jgi:hypothetical protein
MELFISGLGGLAILGLIVIGVVAVYILVRKFLSIRETNQPKFIGSTKCPLCGGKIEQARGAPHIIHCNSPKCPNYPSNI